MILIQSMIDSILKFQLVKVKKELLAIAGIDIICAFVRWKKVLKLSSKLWIKFPKVMSLQQFKRVKPPVGQVYARVENPRGELGYFIISDGSLNPYRVKVRAPSFVNMEVFGELCKGHMVADVVAILGSIDIVLGEIDR